MFSLPREAIDRGHTWGDFILSFRKQATSSLGYAVYGQVLKDNSGASAREPTPETGELKSAELCTASHPSTEMEDKQS